MSSDNDYTQAGFDKFLSRGDNQGLQGTLDNESISNNAVAFDRTQTTGRVGDKFQAGNVTVSGPTNSITVTDDNNNLRILLGQQTDGNQGITVSKEGKDANINRPKDLIFNSNQDIFKVALTGTYTWPSQGVIGANTAIPADPVVFILKDKIAHNLGITPVVQCHIKVDAGTSGNYFNTPIYIPWNNLFQLSGGVAPYNHVFTPQGSNNSVFYELFAGADDKYLYVGLRIGNNDGTNSYNTIPITFTYFVYLNSAAG